MIAADGLWPAHGRWGVASVGLAAMLLAALSGAGCSRASTATETTRKENVAVCAKEGDRCEFAPGKIGLCTAKEGSTSLTCVSLH